MTVLDFAEGRTLSELREQVKLLGYDARLDDQIDAALNSVQRTVCGLKRWTFLERTVTTTQVAGDDRLELNTIPGDILSIDAVQVYNTDGTKYDSEFMGYQEFRARQSDWNDLTGQPFYWTRYRQMLLFAPVPDVDYLLAIDCIITPPAMVEDDDRAVIPDAYCDALVWGAVRWMAVRQRDTATEQLANNNYSQVIQSMLTSYTHRQRQNSTQVPTWRGFDIYEPITFQTGASSIGGGGGIGTTLSTDLGVNVTAFGASITDGVTDATPAIQAAIDSLAATGGTVFFPPGDYKLASAVTLRSNVHLLGHSSGTTHLIINDGWTSSAIQATGVAGAEKGVVGDYTRGDTEFTTTTPHGLAADDYIRVWGQRNSLSDDASDDWRLGYGTPGAGLCYYGEFLQVKSIDSSVSFTTYTGLVFPYYFDDDFLETDVSAIRPSTTVQKITFLEDASVENIRFSILGNTGGAVRGNYSRNVRVINCDVDLSDFQGGAVYWNDSLDCYSIQVAVRYGAGGTFLDADHAKYTPFHHVGSQHCITDSCTIRNAGQCVDFTYSSGGVCSLFNVMRDCTVWGAWSSAATSHGGTYANEFRDNDLYGVHQGLVIRSRTSKAIGNTITHIGNLPVSGDTLYGIAIYEGWARDCDISDNTVIGFFNAFGIIDGADAGETFGYAGVVFDSNTIRDCVNGFKSFRAASAVNDVAGVTITGNNLRNITGKTITLETVVDFTIDNNRGSELVGGIELEDCSDGSVGLNVLRAASVGVGEGIIAHTGSGGITLVGNTLKNWNDGIALGTGVTGCTLSANRFPGVTDDPISLVEMGNIVLGHVYSGSVNVASASTITILGDQNYVALTGSTAVNNITADYIGRIILFRVGSGATATITNAGNVKLATSFGGTVDETVALFCDGVNWHPLMRDA